MIVSVLISVTIAIVVGVVLIPQIVESFSKASEVAEKSGSSAEQRLLDILPIVFVSVIILGAIAWITGSSREKTEKLDDGRWWWKKERKDPWPKRESGFDIIKDFSNKTKDLNKVVTLEEAIGTISKKVKQYRKGREELETSLFKGRKGTKSRESGKGNWRKRDAKKVKE